MHALDFLRGPLPSFLFLPARQWEGLREKVAAPCRLLARRYDLYSGNEVVLVTNEGNGRLVTSMPKVLIAVMGMERIVPSFRELGLLLPMLVASAGGRPVTTYFSFVNGPRMQDEPDGPEEVHVVVLDNGRSAILPTEFRSILHCIRCGACQNVCPVYRVVGGHGYGAVYGGPIGAVLTPLLVGMERAGDLPHASSLCGACSEVCPVGIPLHEHLLGLRRVAAELQAPPSERAVFSAPRRPAWGRSPSPHGAGSAGPPGRSGAGPEAGTSPRWPAGPSGSACGTGAHAVGGPSSPWSAPGSWPGSGKAWPACRGPRCRRRSR